MVTPRAGSGVCKACFELSCSSEFCHRCTRGSGGLAAVVPISYSIAHEQLHEALAGYKRLDAPRARWLGVALAGVLWRFLALHEPCVALTAGARSFDLVTSVPSGDPVRAGAHPLDGMVRELVGPTRSRCERLLRRSSVEVRSREFSLYKYESVRSLAGEAVLLIDDTWTTGASARSAAAALRAAGAGTVAAVVIGRHVNRAWGQNDQQLQSLPPFDWSACAVCAPAAHPTSAANEATRL
jgi:predicted amidophosphoribosyltransferase